MTRKIKIEETNNLVLIKKALITTLYVPNERLKPYIIKELTSYLKSKFNENNYKLKVFVAFEREEICGFTVCQIEPEYKSRNRKCGSFGWLNAESFEICQGLLEACEDFIKKNNIRLLRGNINFPKGLGGLGIQTMGFNERMMYGVAFINPQSEILSFLNDLGYKGDSEYLCMEVTSKEWKKGNVLDRSIKLQHLSLEEIIQRKDEILNCARSAFSAVIPDSTTGEHRFNEIIEIYSKVPDSFYKLDKKFNPRDFSDIPEFLEDWESSNLEKRVTWAHFAIERETDEIVGAIFTLPDLYQLWLNEPITRANVDTAMIKSGYTGKGIFSSMNNIGQITSSFNGVTYFEGTGIWVANEDAIKTILPHCKTNRKFVVVQKRIKKGE